jgi:hypothetical protein
LETGEAPWLTLVEHAPAPLRLGLPPQFHLKILKRRGQSAGPAIGAAEPLGEALRRRVGGSMQWITSSQPSVSNAQSIAATAAS